MNDEAAFLATIAAHPLEDTPRLAYADWLDEHDLPIRAEFIRVQIEIKKYEHLPSTQQQGYADLYRRQDTLLTEHRTELLGPLGQDLSEISMMHNVVFDRGFVIELRLIAPTFLKHQDLLAEWMPLPRITVSATRLELVRLLGVNANTDRAVRREVVAALELHGGTDLIDDDDWSQVEKLHTWPRLDTLSLAQGAFGDTFAPQLLQPESFPALVNLNLSANDLTDTGVISLISSRLWPQLRSLSLERNPITDEGALALADAPPTKLEHLNLRYTWTGHVGQQRLLRRRGWKVDLFREVACRATGFVAKARSVP